MTLVDTLNRFGVPRQFHELARRYFQLEVLGEENLPKPGDGPCMLVAKHAPFIQLDSLLLYSLLISLDPGRAVRPLVWPGFLKGPWGPLFRSLGCEPASIATGTALLKAGETVLIYPEGIGAADVRNRINRFHTGYLRMLRSHPVPVIPIGHYGVNEALPWFVSKNRWAVDTVMKKIDPAWDFIAWPKMLLPRPTKIVVAVGAPVRLTGDDLATEDRIQRHNRHIVSLIAGLIDQAETYRRDQVGANAPNRLFHKLVEGQTTLLYEE